MPLIVKGPGVTPGATSDPVQLIDLYPTLLALAELQPPHELQGDNLAGMLFDGERAPDPSGALSHNMRQDSPLATLRVGSEKIIEVRHDGEIRYLLFDIAEDPGEKNDLSAVRPERFEELKVLLAQSKLRSAEMEASSVERVEITDEMADNLAELGYTEGDEDEEESGE